MATVIPTNEAGFVLGQIAATCAGRIDPSFAGRRVRGVVTDSRAVTQGSLYVALRGDNHDGHRFLADVHARGAAAAIVERAEQAPRELPVVVVADARRALGELALLHRTRWAGKVVAITGSAGKTTTKELTAAAFAALGHRVLRTQGNLNNEIGLPMTLLGLTASHDLAVVEMGTSGHGEIARLARIARADVGVVTTVSLAHTAGLGSLAEVADEKCALLRALGKDGVAVYSADSDVLHERVATFGAPRVLSFGEHESASVRLMRHALSDSLTSHCAYRVQGRALPLVLELTLSGIGPALDVGAALAAVLALHDVAALETAGEGICAVKPLAGRLAPRRTPTGALVIDDTYNANPASMLASLRTLAELSHARGGAAIAALGDMAELGAHAQSEHERVGRDAVRLGISALFLCGSEMLHAAEAARAEAAEHKLSPRIEHFADPAQSLPLLAAALGARDALLVKGSRSMRMERIVDALCPTSGVGGRA